MIGCDAPDNGVLALAFLLETPPPGETRVVPDQGATGLPPFAFARATGRCDLSPPEHRIRCTFKGLPTAPATHPFTYRLALLVGYGQVTPRFDARAIDRDPGGRDPDAPPPVAIPPLPRAMLGPVAPDAFGAVERTIVTTDVPLARVVGGELHAEVNREGGEPTKYLVIDGRLGNLPDGSDLAGTDLAAATAGHQH